MPAVPKNLLKKMPGRAETARLLALRPTGAEAGLRAAGRRQPPVRHRRRPPKIPHLAGPTTSAPTSCAVDRAALQKGAVARLDAGGEDASTSAASRHRSRWRGRISLARRPPTETVCALVVLAVDSFPPEGSVSAYPVSRFPRRSLCVSARVSAELPAPTFPERFGIRSVNYPGRTGNGCRLGSRRRRNAPFRGAARYRRRRVPGRTARRPDERSRNAAAAAFRVSFRDGLAM